MQLRVAQMIPSTEAEGPGKRFALWVQGCTLHCEGCCNPEMFTADRGGQLLDTADVVKRILEVPELEGISILGGEPFQQPAALTEVCTALNSAGLSVMIYSGYTLQELRAKNDQHVNALLATTDLLVDGRYDKTKPEKSRRWIGSSNQQIHFFTPRYTPADPRFTTGNTVELRFENGRLTVNGWPATADLLRRTLR